VPEITSGKLPKDVAKTSEIAKLMVEAGSDVERGLRRVASGPRATSLEQFENSTASCCEHCRTCGSTSCGSMRRTTSSWRLSYAEFPLCSIFTFDDGDRLARERIYYDRANVLRQSWLPKGLSAKDRNKSVIDWLGANGYSLPTNPERAIQRVLKRQPSE
jgi:hypothetical protein